jgi:phage baseplate assembly protein W
MEYLSLPFVLREGYLDRANLLESLTYSIGLILCTRVGTMPFDPDFGCDIWDREFTDLQTVNKANIRSSLRMAIGQYEKRLYNVSVSFVGMEDGSHHVLGMKVKVSGNYKDENDEERKFDASYNLE